MSNTENNHGGNQEGLFESQGFENTNIENGDDVKASFDIEIVEADLESEDLDTLKDNGIAAFNELYRLMRVFGENDGDMPESSYEDYARGQFLSMHEKEDRDTMRFNTRFALEQIDRYNRVLAKQAAEEKPKIETPLFDDVVVQDKEDIEAVRKRLSRLYLARLYVAKASGIEIGKKDSVVTLKNFASRTGLAYEYVRAKIKENPEKYGAEIRETTFSARQRGHGFAVPMSAQELLVDDYIDYELFDLFCPEEGDSYCEDDLLKLFPRAEQSWVRFHLDGLRLRRTGNKSSISDKNLPWSGSKTVELIEQERAKLETTDGVSTYSPKQMEEVIIDDLRFAQFKIRYPAMLYQILSAIPKTEMPMVCGKTGNVVNNIIRSEDVEAGWEIWKDSQMIRANYRDQIKHEEWLTKLKNEQKYYESRPAQDYESGYDPEDRKYGGL
jgi:hypothetical protein